MKGSNRSAGCKGLHGFRKCFQSSHMLRSKMWYTFIRTRSSVDGSKITKRVPASTNSVTTSRAFIGTQGQQATRRRRGRTHEQRNCSTTVKPMRYCMYIHSNHHTMRRYLLSCPRTMSRHNLVRKRIYTSSQPDLHATSPSRYHQPPTARGPKLYRLSPSISSSHLSED